MNNTEFDFLPLRVKHISTNGKRWYDPAAKRRLVAACEQPGASIAGLALRAEVNANRLHKWIRLEQKRRGAARDDASEPRASAFVPVLAVSRDAPVATTRPREAAPANSMACLSAQLPNGVTLRLEGVGGADSALLATMIASLSAR